MNFSQRLITKLNNSDSFAVFTGAGISAESGVPHFAVKKASGKNSNRRKLANFDAFIRNPDLVWER